MTHAQIGHVHDQERRPTQTAASSQTRAILRAIRRRRPIERVDALSTRRPHRGTSTRRRTARCHPCHPDLRCLPQYPPDRTRRSARPLRIEALTLAEGACVRRRPASSTGHTVRCCTQRAPISVSLVRIAASEPWPCARNDVSGLRPSVSTSVFNQPGGYGGAAAGRRDLSGMSLPGWAGRRDSAVRRSRPGGGRRDRHRGRHRRPAST